MRVASRRDLIRALAATPLALSAMARPANAQSFPSRPVRIMVGFAPGGSTDIAARMIAQWLSERLGQQFVVENRPGASANLAAEAVARAPADGYTLLAMSSTNTVNETLFDKLNFSLKMDFAMVSGLIRSPLVMEVHPSFPASSVPEFVAYAKANPGKVTMASFGAGSSSHVAGELFKMQAGVDLTHVPYRGSGPMLTDLLGGQVQMTFDNLPASIEHIKAGKLRALAVTTSARSGALPDVPTLADFVPGYEASAIIGICTPKNTPKEIVDLLNREINAGLANPQMRARLSALSADPLPTTVEEFTKLVAEEIDKWANVVKSARIKPE